MKRKWLPGLAVPVILGWATSAGAVASAELYQPQAYFYGRFEARLRFAAGDGVISSFFLWKAGSEVAGTFWNELDFEKLGADCHLQTNPLYGAPLVDHSQMAAIGADPCADYHTYTFEWTPTSIAWLVDGVELRRETGAAATAYAENATAGMQIHFNIWPGDASFGGNFSPAILPVREYLSWVQYSSYANGTFTQEWREEFAGATLPAGWSTGNWGSPKNLSTHAPANISLVDGFAVLSLTPDNATGFTGVPPVDNGGGDSGSSTGAGGMGGSGGSSAGGSNGCSCRLPATSRSGDGVGMLALGLGTLLACRRQRRPRVSTRPR